MTSPTGGAIAGRSGHDDAGPLADVQPGARHPAKGADDTAIADPAAVPLLLLFVFVGRRMVAGILDAPQGLTGDRCSPHSDVLAAP
jgi:hypothetical protein